jgi:pilus assembly protein CpaF
MRPDRVVVGEVRGGEVCDLLAALNTGHDGGAGTVHANSVREVPARMEALAALGGMDRAALHSQLAAAVQVVLHMRRLTRGRVLQAVGVLRREPAGVAVVPVWERGTGWTSHRPHLEALLADRGVAAPWDADPGAVPSPAPGSPRSAATPAPGLDPGPATGPRSAGLALTGPPRSAPRGGRPS